MIGRYAAAPTMSRAITTQTPTIANPRRRSAPFCLLRIWSIFAWRSDLADFAVLATGVSSVWSWKRWRELSRAESTE